MTRTAPIVYARFRGEWLLLTLDYLYTDERGVEQWVAYWAEPDLPEGYRVQMLPARTNITVLI